MAMSGRSWSASDYRYGYQGSKINRETYGNANQYTTEFRQLDPRFGRWFSTDPVFQPWQSPYNSMDGDPLNFIDLLGDTAGVHLGKNPVDNGTTEGQKGERTRKRSSGASGGTYIEKVADVYWHGGLVVMRLILVLGIFLKYISGSISSFTNSFNEV